MKKNGNGSKPVSPQANESMLILKGKIPENNMAFFVSGFNESGLGAHGTLKAKRAADESLIIEAAFPPGMEGFLSCTAVDRLFKNFGVSPTRVGIR